MKIVTYNMRFGGRGRVHWNEILEAYAPDVLFVQESFAPSQHLSPLIHGKRHGNAVWFPVESNGKTLDWGSGVYIESCFPKPLSLPNFAGWVTGVELERIRCPVGEQRLRVFSVHAPTGMGSYQKAVNSILDMLLDYRDSCDVVIGGDFNLTVSERLDSEDRRTEKADLKIQARLREEFGLINCWQAANPDKPLSQTLRWGSDQTVPYHCDGLFVPASWATALRSCDVLSGAKWDSLSDHNPVIADFEIVGATA